MATIRDVAREAGVSIATVSRTLRDPDVVKPDTRAKVLATAERLAFRPSHLGRQLAERRHAAAGVVFPDLSGPYYADVVMGYESVAAEVGRSVLICSTRGRADVEKQVTEMAGRCDGLVVLGPAIPDALLRDLARQHVPLVLVARPTSPEQDSVSTAATASGHALVRHLLEDGARHLVFVGDPSTSPDVADRLAAVRQALEASPEPTTLTIHPVDDLDETHGRAAADALLAQPTHGGEPGTLPDALVCANDELALGVLTRLTEAGRDGEVRVTGWDDVMAARWAGLTTVRQPVRELGATAARLLEERLAGTRTTPRHEVLETELVVRTSSTLLGKDHA
ncbi:LacI family DNA-binding transcriptional regulator [Nocardioides sp. GY 10127]|uniref:LacI family DNA-binding transcriptional regulator n=1 Tax=Nocardioides sp. GY 10127 TaxID=2569762 RepID=UPI0010A8B961|nr:LacI family DNA-binding transcriptional regulator [Nocardioides sp. GY 10127]TIC84424.1 LacI family transcriptional regulator [Nocardioides sp. GY 10127]